MQNTHLHDLSVQVIIPARGGSKRLPGKHQLLLGEIPLLSYTLRTALSVFTPKQIIFSSDDSTLLELAAKEGIVYRDKRPEQWAQDTTSTQEVLIYLYEKYKWSAKWVLLLQPTSPFRTAQHILDSSLELSEETEGLFSVTEAKDLDHSLREITETGLLVPTLPVSLSRQSGKRVRLNGALYWFRKKDWLNAGDLHSLGRVKPYLMSLNSSVDIDTPEDFLWAQFLVQHQLHV
jgi:N-acylneuraminate cytidylyltransferase